MLHGAQGCQQLWGPILCIWEPKCEEEPFRRAKGWDPGQAPEAVRNTHPGSRAVTQLSARLGDWVKGQPVVSGDANDGCPKLDQGCPSAEDLGRGLGAGCAAECEPRQSPKLCGEGRRRSPDNYYGLHPEFCRGSQGKRSEGLRGRGSEGFQASPLKRCSKQHPRPLLSAPAQVCSIRAAVPQPGRRKGRRKEPLPGSDATGPRPPAPLST